MESLPTGCSWQNLGRLLDTISLSCILLPPDSIKAVTKHYWFYLKIKLISIHFSPSASSSLVHRYLDLPGLPQLYFSCFSLTILFPSKLYCIHSDHKTQIDHVACLMPLWFLISFKLNKSLKASDPMWFCFWLLKLTSCDSPSDSLFRKCLQNIFRWLIDLLWVPLMHLVILCFQALVCVLPVRNTSSYIHQAKYHSPS